jgi:uncharacterized protein YceK
MIRIAMLALALGLTGCGSLRLEPTPTEITHADPMPANPSDEWDAVLVIVPEEGPQERPVPVADAVAYDDGTEAEVLGVLFVDTAYHETWLCASVVDEEGPRCGAPALRVEGLEEVDTSDWQFRSVFNVDWLENASLFGRIERR